MDTARARLRDMRTHSVLRHGLITSIHGYG